MSELAALLPREVHEINHIAMNFSKSVYNDGYDWVVRVIHHDDVRGHALRRYKSRAEAEAALDKLQAYIAAVKRLTSSDS